MQRLVDDLLDLSRIESGRWRPEVAAIDVADTASEIWSDLADRAEEAGVAFSTEIGEGAATLLADPEGVRLVLRNLLDNAVRYTPRGGRIALRSVVAEEGRSR
jgi:signal transduction histidine kinase